MKKQIEARNSVIDKSLKLNLNEPFSLSENAEQVMERQGLSHKKGFSVLPSEVCDEIIVPLYTPDGHSFGEISYSAYSAIQCGSIQRYECLNDREMRILHSYMNYITLNPGMSLVRNW